MARYIKREELPYWRWAINAIGFWLFAILGGICLVGWYVVFINWCLGG